MCLIVAGQVDARVQHTVYSTFFKVAKLESGIFQSPEGAVMVKDRSLELLEHHEL